MSDVLGGVENLERKTIEELTLCEEATNWLKSPAGLGLQKLGDIFKLGNVIVAETNFLFKLINGPVEFLASISLEQGFQSVVAELPGVFLVLGVFKTSNWLVNLVFKGQICDLLTANTVLLVAEAGMICILNSVTFTQNSLANEVEVLNLGGEPWYGGSAQFGNINSQVLLNLGGTFLNISVTKRAHKVDMEVHGAIATDCLWWL